MISSLFSSEFVKREPQKCRNVHALLLWSHPVVVLVLVLVRSGPTGSPSDQLLSAGLNGVGAFVLDVSCVSSGQISQL